MIVRVPLPDEMAARLRALATAERRTPRQQAAHLIEVALAVADRRDHADTDPATRR
jgi:hypothetical protein